ncbi:hypothetical protein ACOSQ2_027677 [Xanthoceras sorbifolium]
MDVDQLIGMKVHDLATGTRAVTSLSGKWSMMNGHMQKADVGFRGSKGSMMGGHAKSCISNSPTLPKLPKWKCLARQGQQTNTVPGRGSGYLKRHFEVSNFDSKGSGAKKH